MDYFKGLIEKYRSKGLIVDTNILLLYFMGQYDLNRISSFKRTKKFSKDDFVLVSNTIAFFSSVITTPNILTEISNLSNTLSGEAREGFFLKFIAQVEVLVETYEPSRKVCENRFFSRLGLTDTGIISLAKGKYLVFTDDFPLSNCLQTLKIDVLNLNHLRSIKWFYR